MKFISTVVAALLITGCQQSQDTAPLKTSSSQTSSPTPTVVVDHSTPDRALKSYWQAKDAYRRMEFDWNTAQMPELQKLKSKIAVDAKKLMTGDVLSAHQGMDARRSLFQEYSREIVDIKQDTESHATAVVKIRNSTPAPEGAVVSDSDKKRREEGERFKYILEKEPDGWKVAQVYQYLDYKTLLNEEPWEKVFSAPIEDESVDVYVNPLNN